MTANAVPVIEPAAVELEMPAPPPSRGPAGVQDMTTGPVTQHLLKTTSFVGSRAANSIGYGRGARASNGGRAGVLARSGAFSGTRVVTGRVSPSKL